MNSKRVYCFIGVDDSSETRCFPLVLKNQHQTVFEAVQDSLKGHAELGHWEVVSLFWPGHFPLSPAMRVINLDDGADLHANVKTIIPETTDIPEPVIVEQKKESILDRIIKEEDPSFFKLRPVASDLPDPELLIDKSQFHTEFPPTMDKMTEEELHTELVKLLRIAVKDDYDGKKRKALSLYSHILALVPDQKHCLIQKGSLLRRTKNYSESEVILKKAKASFPSSWEPLYELGLLYHEMGRVEDAFSNLMEAKDKDDITESQSNDVLAACAQAIYNVKTQQAWATSQDIMYKDENHPHALIIYSYALMEHNHPQDAVRATMKALAVDSNSQRSRERFTELVKKLGSKTVIAEFNESEKSIESAAYLANLLKENGAVASAVALFKYAILSTPTPNLVLNLVHCMEANNQQNQAGKSLVVYFKESGVQTLCGLSNASVSRVLSAGLNNLPLPEIKDQIEYNRDSLTSDTSLDTLALWCVAVKILWLKSKIEAIQLLVSLIKQVTSGETNIHHSHVRNEWAYYLCIQKTLLVSVKVPRLSANLKPVYMIGDSHTLTPAFSEVMWKGETRQLHPMLITGLKAYHLREESTFYTKVNFQKRIKKLPPKSEVLLCFGEIDCRTGILDAYSKCHINSIAEGIEKTTRIHLTVCEKIRNLGHSVSVLPVPPVLDQTRDMVRLYNHSLRGLIERSHGICWIGIEGEYTVDNKLRSEYVLDGTHLHPSAAKLIERN